MPSYNLLLINYVYILYSFKLSVYGLSMFAFKRMIAFL
jgi:hypothetical protein